MKHCCRNCHFLAREYVHDNGERYTFTWTKEEREKGQIRHKEFGAPFCWRGIWHTGVSQEMNSRLEEVIDKNRKNSCYFIEHSDGMIFSAAEELLGKRKEDRRHKRNSFIATTSLCISIAAVIFSIIGFEDVEKYARQLLGG